VGRERSVCRQIAFRVDTTGDKPCGRLFLLCRLSFAVVTLEPQLYMTHALPRICLRQSALKWPLHGHQSRSNLDEVPF
jgi:hypothetical protein